MARPPLHRLAHALDQAADALRHRLKERSGGFGSLEALAYRGHGNESEAMLRGQQQYNVFCSPCHAYTGNGDGMIVRRGYRRPPSLHDERLRQAPAGPLRLMPDLTVRVEDVAVTVAPRALQASAIAGIVVSSDAGDAGGWRDVREVQFEFSRHEDHWLVTRITPIQALQR